MTPALNALRDRVLRVAFALLAAAAFAGPAAAATSGAAVEIPVIVPLTGGGAFIGNAIRQSLDVLEKSENERGGIAGRPLRFTVLDDQSNPAVAVQLFNEAVRKKPPVVLGSGLVANCLAMAPLTGRGGPVHWCLAPGVDPAAGGYTFTSSTSIDDNVASLVRYVRLRGVERIAAVTATDASGQSVDRALNRALGLSENRAMRLVDLQHFNPTDLSTTAQIEHVKAAGAQFVIAWGTGPQFGTLLRAIRDAGLELPVSGGTSALVITQLKQLRDLLPRGLVFPGVISLAEGGVGPGPIREAQSRYFAAFRAAGLTPDIANNIVWDPALMVIDALRKLGPDADGDRLHSYLESLHGWTGINGVYDMRDGSQRGIGQNGSVVDRWDAEHERFVAVSRPAGLLPAPARR